MAKARNKKSTPKAENQKLRTGGMYFSNDINVQIKVDANANEGEKLISCVNLFDGQILGDAGTGKNAIIKQAVQTVNEDFDIEFEVELTDAETEFARNTTKRAVIFLCRDSNGVPVILKGLDRRQTSYVYFITTEAGFLCVKTNASGSDNMATVYKNNQNQACTTALVDNKITIALKNMAETPTDTMGYIKLPDGYSWDVKVIAF